MSSNLVRWGGSAALLAAAMYVGTGILSLFAPQGPVFTSFSDYLIEVMFVIALLGTLAAIAGLHALQSERYGRLGAAGSLAAFVGHALMLVAATATALAGREALDALLPLGVLVALVGLVLLGAATLRARMLPRWCGVLLIAVLPLSAVFDIVTDGAGGTVLGIVWALVGYALLSNSSVLVQRSPRVS
jgi:hypothetical protein